MVKLIIGEKGKGKTVKLLDKVNEDVKNAAGNIIYLDKSDQHIHGLDNSVRLVNVSDYKLQNADQFIGFIKGITSQNYDIQEIYVDGFMKVAHVSEGNIVAVVEQLQAVSRQADIDIFLSVSLAEANIPEEIKKYIFISL